MVENEYRGVLTYLSLPLLTFFKLIAYLPTVSLSTIGRLFSLQRTYKSLSPTKIHRASNQCTDANRVSAPSSLNAAVGLFRDQLCKYFIYTVPASLLQHNVRFWMPLKFWWRMVSVVVKKVPVPADCSSPFSFDSWLSIYCAVHQMDTIRTAVSHAFTPVA